MVEVSNLELDSVVEFETAVVMETLRQTLTGNEILELDLVVVSFATALS